MHHEISIVHKLRGISTTYKHLGKIVYYLRDSKTAACVGGGSILFHCQGSELPWELLTVLYCMYEHITLFVFNSDTPPVHCVGNESRALGSRISWLLVFASKADCSACLIQCGLIQFPGIRNPALVLTKPRPASLLCLFFWSKPNLSILGILYTVNLISSRCTGYN